MWTSVPWQNVFSMIFKKIEKLRAPEPTSTRGKFLGPQLRDALCASFTFSLWPLRHEMYDASSIEESELHKIF